MNKRINSQLPHKEEHLILKPNESSVKDILEAEILVFDRSDNNKLKPISCPYPIESLPLELSTTLLIMNEDIASGFSIINLAIHLKHVF